MMNTAFLLGRISSSHKAHTMTGHGLDGPAWLVGFDGPNSLRSVQKKTAM